jgi:hypothetical protein
MNVCEGKKIIAFLMIVSLRDDFQMLLEQVHLESNRQ